MFDDRARRPIGRQSMMNIDLTVSDLFNQHTGLWYDNLLSALFQHSDFNIIKIMKPRICWPDSFCWAATKNGIYSMKSGYELMFRLKNKVRIDEEEASPSRNLVLQACWKAPTAPKIQVFLWKTLKGALAVSDRLRSRGIKVSDGCMLCEEEIETINHILFLCPYARQVWALANIASPIYGFGNSEFQNLHYLLNLKTFQPNNEESAPKATFTWILWQLWKNRNARLFTNNYMEPMNLVQKALDAAMEWHLANEIKYKVSQTALSYSTIWSPPDKNDFKCNIGFSWSKKFSIYGASWIVRDSKGTVLLYSRRAYSQIASVFEAKLKSWEWALESMQSLHMERITFGASTKEIINAMHKPSLWSVIVSHISHLLAITTNKPNWYLLFEPPLCNLGASLVAESVTKDFRLTSYVARDYPCWLKGFFDPEQRNLIL